MLSVQEIKIIVSVYLFFFLIIFFIKYISPNEKFMKLIVWFFWDISGLQFIWEKIFPPKNKISRKPSTFLFWILGIYTAIYGIAYQKYDHLSDRLDQRSNSIFTQLSSPEYKNVLSLIPELQGYHIPCQPFYFHPKTVINSLLRSDCTYSGVESILRKTIVNFKKRLNKVNLSGLDISSEWLNDSDFSEANLSRANFSRCQLINSKFKGACLEGANFNETILWNANFENITHRPYYNLKYNKEVLSPFMIHGEEGIEKKLKEKVAWNTSIYFEKADLEGANFSKADLGGNSDDKILTNCYTYFTKANLYNVNFIEAWIDNASFEKANLKGAIFTNAILIKADFKDAMGLTAEQLCSAKSIWKAENLDPELKLEVEKNCYRVFIHPIIQEEIKKKLRLYPFTLLYPQNKNKILGEYKFLFERNPDK